MPIVKMLNKKTGITYVYESKSYWDKDKQQPRNVRKLIGKIDPKTGEIVPTGKLGRNSSGGGHGQRTQAVTESPDVPERFGTASVLDQKDREISELKKRVKELESECEHYEIMISRIRSIIRSE